MAKKHIVNIDIPIHATDLKDADDTAQLILQILRSRGYEPTLDHIFKEL